MSAPAELVRRFYAAIQARDAEALDAVIAEAFAADATMRLPESLPYGGTIAGVENIRRLLIGLVTTRRPIVLPDQIDVRRILDGGDQVVAEAVFPWLAPGADEPIEMSAIEWFSFENGQIQEMKVSYWDTAACADALRAAAAAG